MDPKKWMIDTSAWLALLLINEESHGQIETIFRREQKNGTIFYTTNDIIDETITRLIYDNNYRVAILFMKLLGTSLKKRILTQLWTDEQIQIEAFEIIQKFKEHKLSVTDATSTAIMKRFHLDAILTLDTDFKKIGIPSVP